MKYVSNAFSLQMVHNNKYYLKVESISKQSFDHIKRECYSIVGHSEFAMLIGVDYNRETVQLHPGDELYVAQIVSGRMPEGGVLELPEDTIVKYKKVTVCD